MKKYDKGLLKEMLIRHEGIRLKPYRCTAGKLTIGIGRNLDDNGISHEEADTLLDNDISSVYIDLATNFSWFYKMSGERQMAMIDMRFNLGHGGFRKFKHMLSALEVGNFSKAADEMLNSKWSDQVGRRSIELAGMMRRG